MKNNTFLLFASLTVLLAYLVFRVFVRIDYQRNNKLSVFSTLLEFLVFAIHANCPYTFLPVKWPTFPSLPQSTIHTVAGLGLVVIGVLSTLWAMSGLGLQKALGQKQDGLNRVGFYQYTRNPQIVAYGLVVVGLAILWPSIYSLGWVLVYCVIVHMMVITEEEYLLRIFNIEYESYCREVPRYIPIPWRRKKTA